MLLPSCGVSDFGCSALVVFPGCPCNYVGVVNKFGPVQAGIMHSTRLEVSVVIPSCSALSGAVGAELGMVPLKRAFICSVHIVTSV